mmetsp:Transcript_39190/g.124573  ORF Transcript_39190/g.124573 Transcript_39190/m.124573 type:complete len:339 (-) Transcript_39190:215-1231(-)
MTSPACSWTLKVELNGELRRLRHWPAEGQEVTVAAVRAAIGRLYNLDSEASAMLVLKYKDDEGDVCTLTEHTLPDALFLATKSARTLRLMCALGCQAGSTIAAAARADSTGALEASTANGPSLEPTQPPTEGDPESLAAMVRSQISRRADEARAGVAELHAAAMQPGGLREYSATLQGRLAERVTEARAAAREARGAASGAYRQASHGDARGAVGLLAAAAVPATVMALGPGRCVRLGVLAAGTMAVARMGSGLFGAADGAEASAASAAAADAAATPHHEDEGCTHQAAEGSAAAAGEHSQQADGVEAPESSDIVGEAAAMQRRPPEAADGTQRQGMD